MSPEFMQAVSQEPNPGEVFKNPDGSLYIPISFIENKLDSMFKGMWSFEMTRETFHSRTISACGTLTYRDDESYDDKIRKTGTAAIACGEDMKLDYPALEARVLMNAAKKIGRWFGRDLNRVIDDAPHPDEPLGSDQSFSVQVFDSRKIQEQIDRISQTIKGEPQQATPPAIDEYKFWVTNNFITQPTEQTDEPKQPPF